ncbi:hypothetical protein ZHAS_00005702 [Anopheles sinensis]|uniref:Uncharacterized protein n=1 Tax=Anopheles sinensis TaxID=74873 RepID=A0A084VK54_ANOSI|nr:hypothetical protein ZHAS_00005702 [Anopheles sinensis]
MSVGVCLSAFDGGNAVSKYVNRGRLSSVGRKSEGLLAKHEMVANVLIRCGTLTDSAVTRQPVQTAFPDHPATGIHWTMMAGAPEHLHPAFRPTKRSTMAFRFRSCAYGICTERIGIRLRMGGTIQTPNR